jgi:hypothetical protein
MGLLQRKCSCGAQSHGNSECAECAKKHNTLQRKLTIGASNDPLEAEADRVADQVMTGTMRDRIDGAALRIQRLGSTRADSSETETPPSVDRALSDSGQPLESMLRRDMQQRFGYDFSHVRVHAGDAAAQSAREINANAYTVGHDIVFAASRFTPGTTAGQHLLAHELTHVVQQSGADGLRVASGSGAVAARANRIPTTIQKDDAGGGSTEFKDSVSVVSRPTSGPGVVSGEVTRVETAPAKGKDSAQEIHRGTMKIRFDPSDCSVTIPFGYNFVQAPQAAGTGICDSPPPATKVPLLSADRFKQIKDGVLADVNRGLNGWFNVRLAGKSCPGGCADRALPIRVVATEDSANPDTTITVVNRGGRANAATICAGSWDSPTAEHEGGHQTLGVGDEYPETDERLRATVPQWFRPERVRNDYSKMGPAEDSRFAMFHERHFNAVKTFMEDAFPGCKATLETQSRPVLPDFRFVVGGGYASLSGVSGSFLEAGLRIGIPLDRMRRWEVVMGPQINWLNAFGHERDQSAFLLGARLGLDGSTGGSGHGFTAGAFGEAGYGWFSSNDWRSAGVNDRSASAAYGEVGVGAGYRTPLVGGSTRFDFRAEGAAGTAFGAPSAAGRTPADIESDPQRSKWFRLGVTAGVQF